MRWLILPLFAGLVVYLSSSLLAPFEGWALKLALVSVATPFLAILGLVFAYWRRSKGDDLGIFADILQRTAFLGMGYLSFLLVGVLIRDLAAFAVPSLYSRAGSLGIMLLSLVLMIVGYFGARHSLKVKEVEVPLEKLHASLDGFRIVQLSDVHVSPGIRRPFIEKIVGIVNSCNADVVVLTGDIADGLAADHAHDAAPFADLKARYAKYYVSGNHEYYWGADSWIEYFERLGLKTLHNVNESLAVNDARILFAGVPDAMAAHTGGEAPNVERALHGSSKADYPRILLSHQTRKLAHPAAANGVDLMISGHTHGGQFFPWTLVVSAIDRFAHGLRRLDGTWVYVSRGTGYWGPALRLGSPPEVTLLVLRAAKSLKN